MKQNIRKLRRQKRIRKNIRSVSNLCRLSIFRSNKHMYAQVIDDAKGKTLFGVSEKQIEVKGTKTDKAKALGIFLAQTAKTKKVEKVVFDKGSYRYHGRVKAFADGAREGGLQF